MQVLFLFTKLQNSFIYLFVYLQNFQSPSQPREITEFEKAKRDFLSYLSGDFFNNYLKPASELPLSEILIYNKVDVLRSSFDGIPRAALHKALCDPSHYLQVCLVPLLKVEIFFLNTIIMFA